VKVKNPAAYKTSTCSTPKQLQRVISILSMAWIWAHFS